MGHHLPPNEYHLLPPPFQRVCVCVRIVFGKGEVGKSGRWEDEKMGRGKREEGRGKREVWKSGSWGEGKSQAGKMGRGKMGSREVGKLGRWEAGSWELGT